MMNEQLPFSTLSPNSVPSLESPMSADVPITPSPLDSRYIKHYFLVLFQCKFDRYSSLPTPQLLVGFSASSANKAVKEFSNSNEGVMKNLYEFLNRFNRSQIV